MRSLPLADPGVADHRSPTAFLWWLAKGQWRTLLGGMFFGIVWMSSQAVMPAILGRAIDRGIASGDTAALLRYAGMMFLVGLIQAAAGIIRHRFAVSNWLTAAYRTVQLVTRKSVELGGSLPRKVSTGEVVAIGSSDLSHLGQVMDVSARFSGAIVSFVLVSVILLNTSIGLGLLVLLGVPILMLAIGPLLRPLQRRAALQRHLMGELSNTASDIVGGLRVLRGIGGERVFSERYRRESQTTRQAGVQVARVQSLLDALQVLLPGIFVVLVVWVGARYAVAGRITPGQLVAFYGYSAFLMIPLRTATEYANKVIRALVAARRVCSVLALQPDYVEVTQPEPAPAPGADLVDLRSGLCVKGGRVTAVVSPDPDSAAALADRLGLQSDTLVADDVRWGGLPISRIDRVEVRRRIVVSDTASALFSGRLREQLDPRGVASPAQVADAMATASAGDILDTLPEGLATEVAERGRLFSGGQRQRLVLARALVADPEIMVLVEPTSAVDAHTEARIAARLRGARAGRTTVVITSSPLMLDHVDTVAFLVDGRVTASGTHEHLMDNNPAYRDVVTRGMASEERGIMGSLRSGEHP